MFVCAQVHEENGVRQRNAAATEVQFNMTYLLFPTCWERTTVDMRHSAFAGFRCRIRLVSLCFL